MARRYKSYAAETGTAYQYFFAHSRSVGRPEGQGTGVDYVFVVTPDQRPPFFLRVFISGRALGLGGRIMGVTSTRTKCTPSPICACFAPSMRLMSSVKSG